ncbi:hypothetical protein VNO78_27723 [Psophocarpus tetragonolobus]|uniref:Disease resistance protein n=1 Tax=Psophocarpus tetragonolobus TaxID=3891 RepID=A0AAN9XBL9_PSOTE
MAEIAASLVVDNLLKLVVNEAAILGSVKEEVEGIKNQLNVIKCFIRDAEEKQVGEEAVKVKEWVNELRKVAFRMEDVVDKYLLKVAERGQRHGIHGKLTKGKEMFKTLSHNHDIASQIKDIKETLVRLYNDRLALGLQQSPIHPTSTPRLGAHFVEESQLVGMETNKQELTRWLTTKPTPAMVVIGPGGIGKTAIVKNVYNKQEKISLEKNKDNKEANNFEFCAWINMSELQVEDHNVVISQIIENIIEKDRSASATLRSDTTTLESHVRKVKEYLTNKRYLIVFDDVKELRFWDVTKHALIPKGNKNSKVIFITRDEIVAEVIGSDAPVEVRKVEALSPRDALMLFRQKAFQFEQVQYPELNGLSEEFVKQCNGVPQAIVAIAGLLSTKGKTTTEWRRDQLFCRVMKDPIALPNSLDSVPRRLSIIKKNDNASIINKDQNWKKVRSCLVFDDSKKWLVSKDFFSGFELLVRLDLSNARLDKLPEQLGHLLNLKYLSLRNTNVMRLPKSFGNLVNLQTLDLKKTQVREEVDIKKLVKLRHLLAYFISNQHSDMSYLYGVKLSDGLQNLKSLQKLSFLDASDGRIIEGLKQLKNLRKLGIVELEKQFGVSLCQAIENMTQLCSLSIWAAKDGMLQLQYSFKSPPTSLHRLYLNGRLECLPKWIPKLPNLSRVYLKWSNLKEDPLPYLKDLPELLYLELYDSYVGDELHFKNGWFKLKILYLGSLPNLKTIKIDEGAIPYLTELKIGKCHSMVHVPSDLRYLTSLKKLYFYDMPEQFIRRMKDPQIHRHIPIGVLHLSNYDLSDTLRDHDS